MEVKTTIAEIRAKDRDREIEELPKVIEIAVVEVTKGRSKIITSFIGSLISYFEDQKILSKFFQLKYKKLILNF